MDVDAAAKDAAGGPVQDALVEFVTGTVRFGVFDQGVVVHVLFPVQVVEAVYGGLTPLPSQQGVDFAADQPSPQRDGVGGDVAVGPLAGLQGGDMEGLGAL